MIQFKRGSTRNWQKNKTPLADGQPGYDRDKHRLKIGDGTSTWEELPYVAGFFDDDILCAEKDAKNDTIFTYGKSLPTRKTKGKVYLQQFDGDVESDFVVETGRNINYFYRKWNSGLMECWGRGTAPKLIKNLFESIIFDNKTDDYFELKGFWK